MHRLLPPISTHTPPPAGLAGHSSRPVPSRPRHVWPCADVPAGPAVRPRGGRAAAGKAQNPGAAEVRPQPPSSSKAGRTHWRGKRQAACGREAGLARRVCAGVVLVLVSACVCMWVTASEFSEPPWTTGLVVASVLQFHLLHHQNRHCDSCRCRRHRHPASQERNLTRHTRLSSTIQLAPTHTHTLSVPAAAALLLRVCCQPQHHLGVPSARLVQTAGHVVFLSRTSNLHQQQEQQQQCSSIPMSSALQPGRLCQHGLC